MAAKKNLVLAQGGTGLSMHEIGQGQILVLLFVQLPNATDADVAAG